MLKHYYILLIGVLQITLGATNYFCDFHCRGNKEHTACKRMPCRLSKACGQNASALPLTDEDRQWILDVHNTFRNKIASGKDTIGGNGEAANMRALSYDKELEFVAQCWSNACRETGASHDACRITKKFSSVGQNMFSSGTTDSSTDFRDKKYLTQAVTGWYNEIKDCNRAEIDSFAGNTQRPIGHFTQVIWATTTHIGCGRTYYVENSMYSVYVYCNYGPGGNLLGAPVYERGKPCSNCGTLKCNGKYASLCGSIEDLKSDTWTSPFGMQLVGGQPRLRLKNNLYIRLIVVTILPML